MTLLKIANEFNEAKYKITYNHNKVAFRLYCCRNYPNYQMKEDYKFDTLVYNPYLLERGCIKLYYKNRLVVELSKFNCVWIAAIYLESKHVSFKLIDYGYAEVE